MTTTTTTPPTHDPHGLLASGAELATEGELARLLCVSRAALAPLLSGPMYGLVRYVDARPAPRRYSVADARAAIEPHRAALEERRRLADERQAADQAAAAARRAERARAHEAREQSKRAMPTTPPKTRPVVRGAAGRGVPEIIVRRRPVA